MSAKMIKDGNEYPIGVIPQNYPSTNIGYNNSQSGLSATKVQGAIDEVVGAVEDLENGVVIHTASANQTYGEQMAEIAPYFSNLTQGQKMRSLLKSGNSLYPCISILGIFSLTATGATSISLQSFRLDSIKLFIATNGTVEDYTSRTATNTLSLIVL